MTDILKRLTMTKLKTMNMRNGVAWKGTILLDGKPALFVENDGNGGCNMYSGPNGVREARLFLERTVEPAAREATGLKFEAFDMLTAYMDNGKTAAQVVERVKKELAS